MYIRTRTSNYAMAGLKRTRARTNVNQSARKLEKFEARFEVPRLESHWPNHSFHWCPSNHASLPFSPSKIARQSDAQAIPYSDAVFRVIGDEKICAGERAVCQTDFLSDMYEQLIRQRDKYVGAGLAQVVATFTRGGWNGLILPRRRPRGHTKALIILFTARV